MQAIYSDNVAPAVGPYAHAIDANNTLYMSGQLALNPLTLKLEGECIITQATQMFKNVKSILDTAGYDKNKVVKTTVFLSDMDNFSKLNELYAAFFGEHKPARSCVEVARLPMDALVEIELIAIK
ncbi:endoribonuclease L-PSP [Psychromonas sp. CNPT3]|uniref:Rid family detoxifying hydrolase n=1 Tax=Psychromonas sp. CNPT3 TaxID=314282 RepID=UPI00006E5895|nr:Rid family detoxifying hydrolase [Psychromonas sp. CNPT3]AGH82372.1 endoribonuclease L-PSP [Psychromonas sp. CNPT3]